MQKEKGKQDVSVWAESRFRGRLADHKPLRRAKENTDEKGRGGFGRKRETYLKRLDSTTSPFFRTEIFD